MRFSRTLPLWLALAAALLAIAWLIYAKRHQAARLGQLEAENRRLQAREAEMVPPVGALPPVAVATPHQPVNVPTPRPAPAAGPYTESQVIASLRESLGRAHTSLAELQGRVESLQTEIDQSTGESKRLAASEADLRERLGSSTRLLEALQAELKTKAERMAQLEALGNRLHQENRAVSDRLARMIPWVRELEELNRRRETYLSSLLRRYRDLTDHYRAVAGRPDSPREGAVPNPAELSRIQDTLAGAEEDLRQLTGLNAQAARLQQRIGVK